VAIEATIEKVWLTYPWYFAESTSECAFAARVDFSLTVL
jgi:hypothetical protein